MKTIRAYPLMLLFALAASFPAAGQTKQSGYVKTRGRLADDGRLLPGERLAGASVILKGGNSTVSGADGSFTLTLSGSTYILQNVRKQGYEICDPEILARQYTHSANPHILILETPARKLEEKLAAERKIRRTLQRTLAEREEELETLQAQHQLTRDEYNAALQQLYAAQRNDEQLIEKMATRYAQIDYDQLDDYRRQLSLFIREGELRRADSLLNSRGSFADRAAELERLHEANEQEAARLAGERDVLEKSRKYVAAQLEAFGEDCYARHEICLTRHRPDSAAYYLELRAATDTTNIEWQMDAGEFASQYIADYPKSRLFYNRGLAYALEQYGESHFLVARAYMNIAQINGFEIHFSEALEYFQKALKIYREIYGVQSHWTALAYNNIGALYRIQGRYSEALEQYSKAVEIWKNVYGERAPEIGIVYNNISTVYVSQGKYSEALEYQQKALNLFKEKYEEQHQYIAGSYMGIGILYYYSGQYSKALEYYQKALEIQKVVYSERHPHIALNYNNIGMVYDNQAQYPEALEYFQKALEINKEVFGEEHPNVALNYNNIGVSYLKQGQYPKALEYFQKALEINKKVFGELHPDIVQSHNNIGEAYEKLNQPDKAAEYRSKAQEIINYLQNNP